MLNNDIEIFKRHLLYVFMFRLFFMQIQILAKKDNIPFHLTITHFFIYIYILIDNIFFKNVKEWMWKIDPKKSWKIAFSSMKIQ